MIKKIEKPGRLYSMVETERLILMLKIEDKKTMTYLNLSIPNRKASYVERASIIGPLALITV